MLAGVWFTKGENVRDTPAKADFVIVELETEDDYEGIVNGPIPHCPHAILTNFGPIDPGVLGLKTAQAKAVALITRGYCCLTEAYLGDNEQATPENLDFRAAQLGWPADEAGLHSQPVFGVYNAPVSRFEKWRTWPGHGFYLGENFL